MTDAVTRPISFRLPVELMDRIDALVRDGESTTRTAFVRRALDSELRRIDYAHEAATYDLGQVPPDPELDEWSRAAAHAFSDSDLD